MFHFISQGGVRRQPEEFQSHIIPGEASTAHLCVGNIDCLAAYSAPNAAVQKQKESGDHRWLLWLEWICRDGASHRSWIFPLKSLLTLTQQHYTTKASAGSGVTTMYEVSSYNGFKWQTVSRLTDANSRR